jgi:preprotein translocase subunit YajC
MSELFRFFAQATQPAPAPGGLRGLLYSPFVPLMLGLAVLYFFIMRGQSKDKKAKQQMIDNIKKNDRVMTIGGIIGTVVSVKDDEVTLKVDESTNTKMTFIRRAIQKVYSPDETPGESGG